MKKVNRLLILLMLAVPFVGFTGCDDDDEDNPKSDTKSIEGVYNGALTNTVAEINIPNVDITVTYISETKVNLAFIEIIPIKAISQNLPLNVNCDCDVEFANGVYKLKGNTSTNIPGLGDIPVKIDNSTIDGTGKANFKITPTVMLLPIEITFTGTKVTDK